MELFINSNIKNPRVKVGVLLVYMWVGVSVCTRLPDQTKNDTFP